MAEKNSVIVSSVLITLIISGLGMFVGLPAIYPGMNQDLDEIQGKFDALQTEMDEMEDQGVVLQSLYEQTNVGHIISDNDTVPVELTGCNVSISTEGNSKLLAQFSGGFLLRLMPDFIDKTEYKITVEIGSLINKTTKIAYELDEIVLNVLSFTYDIYISHQTEIIPAGEYTIRVYYESEIPLVVNTSLYDYQGSASDPNNRLSLLVQEISV